MKRYNFYDEAAYVICISITKIIHIVSLFSDNLRGSFIVTMIPQTYEAAMAGRFSMQGNSKNKEYGYDKDELCDRIKNSLYIASGT